LSSPTEKHVADPEKHKRFLAPRGSFVAIGPHFNKVGQIIDIGMDGLSFDYVASEELPDKSFEADILLSDTDFYLERVPCEMISEVKISRKSSFGSLFIRKCSVQFGELTPKQMSQLEYFIQNYAIGIV
jgi:hypothetical protein